jgi:bacillithiol biosynthesis cysteine-adding enzyme BshC
MDYASFPHTRVPKSSALYLDYLYHFDRVAPFFSGSPFAISSYEAVAEGLRVVDRARGEVSEILVRQNQDFESGEATFESLRRLAKPGTLAVVTGQQVGLLSGPAFTLYKALSAVRLAQWLSEQGLPAVPVFWLATEDHDLEEVSQVATLDEDYNLVAFRDAGERPAPRSSVGSVRLSHEILPTLDRLEALLPAAESREHLLRDLRAAYVPGATWGRAFGRLMARLFGRWGVVLVDPLDDGIHRLTVHVYRQALSESLGIQESLQQRSRDLVRTGYHAQVHVAEDSTLVFWAPDGNRRPLYRRDGGFVLDESEKVSLEQLRHDLETQPLTFSASALLRPIVQDVLLPTVAYIAGPSELAYHGQTQVLYPFFGRPQPVVFPRAGFTLVDHKIRRLLEKYRLAVEDVWQGEEHLRRKIAAAGFAEGWSERLDQSERELTALLERLQGDIQMLDPTLLDTVKHVEEKMKYQMERLRGKVSRAALQRSEMLLRHAQSLMRFLMPNRELQEREVSGVYFLGCAGYALLDRILAQIRVDASDHQIIGY